MNRILTLILLSALTFAGCSEGIVFFSEETVAVHAALTLSAMGTRASADGDGAAANVNHWVVEVRDVKYPSKIFYRKEIDSAAGDRQQTFDLVLVKGQTYDIAFWADCRGCYKVSDLTSAEMLDPVGNKDTFDAFCSIKKSYVCTGMDVISSVLTRPLAQINFIAEDLKSFEAHVSPETYAGSKPKDFELTLPVATIYNVYNGAVQQSDVSLRTFKAPDIYGTYSPAAEETTLFMTYVFADTAEAKDLDFRFKSNNADMGANVTNVPVKANYRTNIRGSFFVDTVQCIVTICPEWNQPEFEVVI